MYAIDISANLSNGLLFWITTEPNVSQTDKINYDDMALKHSIDGFLLGLQKK